MAARDRIDPAEHTGMAVVLRNVAGHNWGWFSREDQRMHLQTVDDGAREGRQRAKVWLEERGKRTFDLADGRLSRGELDRLASAVAEERRNIESRWIAWMIDKGWLDVELAGSVVTLSAYPHSHHAFARTLDLRDEFPGASSDRVVRSWELHPPRVDLDPEHALLAVGQDPDRDRRHHLDLAEILFLD
jgi:hypothetical protein